MHPLDQELQLLCSGKSEPKLSGVLEITRSSNIVSLSSHATVRPSSH